MRFPMWHYVDIHDQLICLTSSLYSQMDPSLEPFSNQPPAPAKLSIFTISNILFLVNKLQKLDWNQSMYEDLHADTTLHFFPSHQNIYSEFPKTDSPYTVSKLKKYIL